MDRLKTLDDYKDSSNSFTIKFIKNPFGKLENKKKDEKKKTDTYAGGEKRSIFF